MKPHLPLALISYLTTCIAGASAVYAQTEEPSAECAEQMANRGCVIWKPVAQGERKQKEEEGQGEDLENAAETLLEQEELLVDELDLELPDWEAGRLLLLAGQVGDSCQRVSTVSGVAPVHEARLQTSTTTRNYVAKQRPFGAKYRIPYRLPGSNQVRYFSSDEGAPYAVWDSPEGYTGGFFMQIFLNEGYTASWVSVTEPQELHFKPGSPGAMAYTSVATDGGCPSYTGNSGEREQSLYEKLLLQLFVNIQQQRKKQNRQLQTEQDAGKPVAPAIPAEPALAATDGGEPLSDLEPGQEGEEVRNVNAFNSRLFVRSSEAPAAMIAGAGAVDFPAGDDVSFSADEENKNVLVAGEGVSLHSISIAGAGHTFSGGAISTTGDLILAADATASFDNGLSVGGSVQLNAGSTLTVSQNATLPLAGTGTLEVLGEATANLGSVSGNINYHLAGDGNVNLTVGGNTTVVSTGSTFSGKLTLNISDGYIMMGANNAASPVFAGDSNPELVLEAVGTGTKVLILNNGYSGIDNPFNIGSLSSQSANISIQATNANNPVGSPYRYVSVHQDIDTVFAGTFHNSGERGGEIRDVGLIMNGAGATGGGTLTLTGANPSTAKLIINSGTVALGGDEGKWSGDVIVKPGGQLDLQRDRSLVAGKALSLAGNGVLAGLNNDARVGALVLSNGVTVGVDITIERGGASILTGDNVNATLSGSMTGDALTKLGSGTLNIKAAALLGVSGVSLQAGGITLTDALGADADISHVSMAEDTLLRLKLADTGTLLTHSGSLGGTLEIASGLLRADVDNTSSPGVSKVVMASGTGILFADSDTDKRSVVAYDLDIVSGTLQLRAYGNALLTADNVISGAITGGGVIRKTDGGTITLAGDLSGFTGSIVTSGDYVFSASDSVNNKLVLDTDATVSRLTLGANSTLSVAEGRVINALTTEGGSDKTGTLNVQAGARADLGNVSGVAYYHLSGSGTIRLKTQGNMYTLASTGNTFGGTLTIEIGNSHFLLSDENATSPVFTGDARPDLVLVNNNANANNGFILNRYYHGAGNAFNIGSLSSDTPNAHIRGDYKDKPEGAEDFRYISVHQDADTSFAGLFEDNGNRSVGLIMNGAGATGGGTLTLTGANPSTAKLIINSGTVALGGDEGKWSGDVTVKPGGQLDLQRDGSLVAGKALSLAGNGVLAGLNNEARVGALVLANGVTVGSAVSIGGGGASILTGAGISATISGNVSGGALTKLGSGTLTLAAANTTTANLLISSGTVALGGTNGKWLGDVVVEAGGQLHLQHNASLDSNKKLIIAGDGVAACVDAKGVQHAARQGALKIGDGVTLVHPVEISAGGASIAVDAEDHAGISREISGSGDLTKYGEGTLTLSGANTATGDLEVAAGHLVLCGDNRSWNAVSIADGADLTLNQGSIVNYNALTNDGHLLIGYDMTLDTAIAGSGDIETLDSVRLTVTGDISASRMGKNLGVLALVEQGRIDLSSMDNSSGLVELYNVQTLESLNGDLTIFGDGRMILGQASELGNLTLDLANASLQAEARLVDASGLSATAFTLSNYTSLAEGTYNLLSTTEESARSLAVLLGDISSTEYKDFLLVRNGGLLQLQVSNNPQAYTERKILTANEQIPGDVPVNILGATLITGQNEADRRVGEEFHYGDITVDNGGKLQIWLGHDIHRTILTTDKLIFASNITLLANSTLMTQDGSYYFSGAITVRGNATVINQWDKGLVYNAINGVSPETDKNIVLSFTPSQGDNPQLITFAGEGDFGGKVKLGPRTRTRYVIDNARAFKNAVLELSGNVYVGFNKEEVILRGLAGAANSHLYVVTDADFLDGTSMTVSGIGADAGLESTLLTITGDANQTYSGTFGGGIALKITAGAAQTLGGTSATLTSIETAGNLTLNGATTVQGDVTIAAGGKLTANSSLSLGAESRISNSGTLALGSNATVDFSKLTNSGTLQLGNTVTLEAGTVAGGGALQVLSGGVVTAASANALSSIGNITVSDGGTLHLTEGYVQKEGQSLRNFGTINLGGQVDLLSPIVNAGEVSLAANTVFALDANPAWQNIIDNHGNSLRSTITVIDCSLGGTVTGWEAMDNSNFTIGNLDIDNSDVIRSISMNSTGTATIVYWGSTHPELVTGGTMERLVLRDQTPYTLRVTGDVTLGVLTSAYTTDHGQVIQTPGTYSFTKSGGATLTILDIPTDEIDKFTVMGGTVVLGDKGHEANEQAGVEAAEPVTVAFEIGTSRILSTGGSMENITIDTETHSISNSKEGTPGVFTDAYLRLGSGINSQTTLSNISFAGDSALSGYITVDRETDSESGKGVGVVAGAGNALTIGTPTNDRLSFNFIRGTIEDPGDDTTGTFHLISVGEGAELRNWDSSHVRFYYEGVLACEVISVGDSGTATIDVSRAKELLWNGTARAWNPTDTTSTAWYTGSLHDYDEHFVLEHTWTTETSRFYALSNVHFDTLTASDAVKDIALSRDLTVMDFTIGTKVDDTYYGDTHPGTAGLETPVIQDSFYNHTAYTFSNGTLRVLRDLYVRTATSLDFEGSFDIEAQHIYLYNKDENATVSFGGDITTDYLNVGQLGVGTDCFGLYRFNGAVRVEKDLYLHVDTTNDVNIGVEQAVFAQTLSVGGDMLLSGTGSKLFQQVVTAAGDLTVTSCVYNEASISTRSNAQFNNALTVGGKLIINNGAKAILNNQNSTVAGSVQMSDGTLLLNGGAGETYGNGGRGFSFELTGDGGELNVAINTYVQVREIFSADENTPHHFTIGGASRNTTISAIRNLQDLTLSGGVATVAAGNGSTGGIHGNLIVRSGSILHLQAGDVFSEDASHDLVVDGAVHMTAGTVQTLGAGSSININSGSIYAPITNNRAKARFEAAGDLTLNFSGPSGGIAADIAMAADSVLSINDTAASKNSLLTLSGAVGVSGKSGVIHLLEGSHVYLESGASLSGKVRVDAGADEEYDFLRSALTVTGDGQIDNVQLTVERNATLNVIASGSVHLDALVMRDSSTLSLAALAGGIDLESSAPCLQIAGGADIGSINLFFQDELRTMCTYAIMELTGGNTFAAGFDPDAISVFLKDDLAADGYTPLARNQYELLLNEERNILYLSTFFGMVWSGGADGGGAWAISDTSKNWSSADFADGSTAIFRDLEKGDPAVLVDNAQVTLTGTIRTDGIYVVSDHTNYTFLGDGTTLRGVTVEQDGQPATLNPSLTVNGEASLTFKDFDDEVFGEIVVHKGTLNLSDARLGYTGSVRVDGGSLNMAEGSSLYESDAVSISGLAGGAVLRGVTAKGGVLAGESAENPGGVSGAAVQGYTVSNITFSGCDSAVDARLGAGVHIAADATLTLSGTTVFTAPVDNEGTLVFADNTAIVDIGSLAYEVDTDAGVRVPGIASRSHTYTLFTGSGDMAEGHVFDSGNVMINGASLSKYKSDYVYVLNVPGQPDNTLTLMFNNVETPHWDKAWGYASNVEPWLGHLITEGVSVDGQVVYTHFDNDATSDEGAYRYWNLLAEGVSSGVDSASVSLVLSSFLDVDANNIFASGDGLYNDNGVPAGDIWVYDKGSKFGTKVAGYNILPDPGSSARFVTRDMVTHMVLEAQADGARTAKVVGGSVNADAAGASGTYLTVQGGSYGEVIGGNENGDLSGDTHVFVHGGNIDTLYAGGKDGSVQNINLTIDGGTLGTVYGSGSADSTIGGNVTANLLKGTLNSYSTQGTVQGDVEVNLSDTLVWQSREIGNEDGTTSTLAPSLMGYTNGSGKTATLNLIRTQEGTFDLGALTINGFDVINIGENTDACDTGNVAFDVRRFMSGYTSGAFHEVAFVGSGTVFFNNETENEQNKENGVGRYSLILTKGITLRINTSYIHAQDAGRDNFPEITVQTGATLDISGEPARAGGGMAVRLKLSGHGVNGLGALYKGEKADSGDTSPANLTALPYISVIGNASIGGTENIYSEANRYNSNAYVDLAHGGANHTLTKQGSNIWYTERVTFTGGTLFITDEGSICFEGLSTTSPWSGNTHEASSSTDMVIGPQASMRVSDNSIQTITGSVTNNFTVRSLSGDGSVVLKNSHLYLYNNAGVTDFYAEFRDSSQRFWNSAGYSYAVFSGKIVNEEGAESGNMLVKAGDGRQILSGSESTYGGTTRMDRGELYLLGTSYGTMSKNSSTVDSGVLGKSTLEWNGGTLTLGNGVRIFNNANALSGASAAGDVSYMDIRVEGGVTEELLLVQEDTLEYHGKVYHLVDTSHVASLAVDGIYEDGVGYGAGSPIDSSRPLYVLQAAGSTVLAQLSTARYNDATYSGVINDSLNGNRGCLVKTGLGTLTIDQYNNYTGGTKVQQGTLNVRGWGLLGGVTGSRAEQTEGTSLMLSYDGTYGKDEIFFINSEMDMLGTGDARWLAEMGHTAALISNVGGDFNSAKAFTLSGKLTGGGNLLHMGKGTLIIDGWKLDGEGDLVHDTAAEANDYTGGTTLTDGRLLVRKNSGLGNTAAGGSANLVTVSGTEFRLEDCTITLGAVHTEDAGGTEIHHGNDIRGRVVIGTAEGKMTGTGATQVDGAYMQTVADIDAGPAVLEMTGDGYYAEYTKIDQDGTLRFDGAAASNYSGSGAAVANQLEGSGSLHVHNEGEGHLQVAFRNIGKDDAGYTGNIVVDGLDATLTFMEGDYNARSSTNPNDGNITVSGTNVTLEASRSNIVITAGAALTLESPADATKGQRAALVDAQDVLISEKGALIVRGPEEDPPLLSEGFAPSLKELKANASLGKVTEVALMSAGEIAPIADGPVHVFVGFAEDPEYDRSYTPGHALNTSASGVVNTSDTGRLTLAAGSSYQAERANVNLAGSKLEFQTSSDQKINLYLLPDGEIVWNEDGLAPQIALFTGVGEFWLTNADTDVSTVYSAASGSGNAIYVFRALDYFQNCWQIGADTFMVYDSGAGVVYLDDVVPEPSVGVLSTLALAALAARRRRKKHGIQHATDES